VPPLIRISQAQVPAVACPCRHPSMAEKRSFIWTGLVITRSIPAFRHSSLISRRACAVRPMMQVRFSPPASFSRMLRVASRPLICGMCRSIKIKSKLPLALLSIASLPVSTTSICHPFRESFMVTISRIIGSSSASSRMRVAGCGSAGTSGGASAGAGQDCSTVFSGREKVKTLPSLLRL
jgi:hypothetical protein